MGEEDADLMLSGIGAGGEELSSLGPLMGLHDVARGRMTREEYTRKHGHRGANEYELSEPRPSEDPGWLDRQLELLEGLDPEALLERRRADAEEAWARYGRRHPAEVESTRGRAAAAAAAARAREAVRSECARMAATARAFALHAAERTGLGEDVFFLSLSELLDALQGRKTPSEIVALRRGAYHRLRALPPFPALIRGRFDPFEWAKSEDRRSDVFDAMADGSREEPRETVVRGLPASGGVVEGRVRHLRSPDEGHLLEPGEILVAVATNVGWTSTFPRAAAIVTDVGAPLSHAAIVARELGIPAVVGTRNGTEVLVDGDLVRVDGARGTVERLTLDP
jgi:pyruvate,water dikinase